MTPYPTEYFCFLIILKNIEKSELQITTENIKFKLELTWKELF